MSGMSYAYGAPPSPKKAPDEKGARKKLEKLRQDKSKETWERPVFAPDPGVKSKVRISTRIGEDGQLYLKVYRVGVLVSESSGHQGGTVTMEIEV